MNDTQRNERPGPFGNPARTFAWIGLLLAVAIGAGVVLAPRWLRDSTPVPPADDEAEEADRQAYEARWAPMLRDGALAGECAKVPGHGKATVQMGTTGEDRPWIGAAEPVLEVREFTDYRCPDCRRAHRKIQRLLAAFPGKVRVVNYHLPMDPSCNPGVDRPVHDRACELARISVCAGRQGRFWETHEFLLQNADAVCAEKRCAMAVARRMDLDEDAFQCCMKDPSVAEAIRLDIAEAAALGARITPTFVIGGRPHEKAIPADALAILAEATP